MSGRRVFRVGMATGLWLILLPLHNVDAFAIRMISSVPLNTALYYRDRYEHEQEHLIVSPTPVKSGALLKVQIPSLTSTASPRNDNNSGIHFEMLVQTAFRQLLALLVTTTWAAVGTEGHLDTLFPVRTHSYDAHLPWCALCILGALASVPLICTHVWLLSHHHLLPAQQAQLRTNDFCDRMFGRRNYHPSHHATSAADVVTYQDESPTTTISRASTVTVLCLVAALTGLVAGAEEIIFRVYAVCGWQHYPQLATALGATDENGVLWFSVLASAVTFGLVHIHPQHRRAENVLVASQQFVCGLWYWFLFSATESLLVPAMAHWLFDWHTLAASWHQSNTQQDYVAEHTAAAVLDDPVATLFFAFDEQRCGTLSHFDVQHAVTFLFSNENPPGVPVSSQVEAELQRLEQKAHDDDHGVSLDVFRRLIFALHQNH